MKLPAFLPFGLEEWQFHIDLPNHTEFLTFLAAVRIKVNLESQASLLINKVQHALKPTNAEPPPPLFLHSSLTPPLLPLPPPAPPLPLCFFPPSSTPPTSLVLLTHSSQRPWPQKVSVNSLETRPHLWSVPWSLFWASGPQIPYLPDGNFTPTSWCAVRVKWGEEWKVSSHNVGTSLTPRPP